jgi:hypothetical protein
VLGEHARLTAIGGIDVDPEPMRTPGAPLMFMLRDPDGNAVVVVEAPITAYDIIGAMADPIVRTPRLEAAMDHIRPVALALPGVVERPSHGAPTFFTAEGPKGRTFASVHDEREWHEGRLCLWAAGPRELQEALVSGGPERFFVPPYVGHRGWIGLRLDLPTVDWDEVFGVIEDAHAYVTDR